MGGSWRIVRVFGIDVKIHWTFLLLFLYVGWRVRVKGGDMQAVVAYCGLIVAVFVCVVLHELGHALTARRYGVSTRDITLLPIGGVARLARIPREPWHEFWIAVAGPAVNVAIALVLAAGLTVAGQALLIPVDEVGAQELAAGTYFLQYLLFVNVMLVAFNALPAFPMDGGRVLRSLLAMKLDYLRATEIAAWVGQGMAMLFLVVGILFSPLLILIAIFVYFGAMGEARMAQLKAITAGLPVSTAMMIRFRTLRPDDTLQTAARELLAGSQQDFSVVEGDQLRGLLSRQQLVDGLHPGAEGRTVGQVMNADVETADEHAMLEDVLMQMREDGRSTLPVVHHEDDGRQRLVGLLTMENIGELLMIRTSLRGGQRPQRMSQTGE